MGDESHNPTSEVQGGGAIDRIAIIHPLADELIAIANRLRSAAGIEPVDSGPVLPDDGEGIETPASKAADVPDSATKCSRPSSSHLALARKAYALRRKRAVIFGNPDLFGEPAWDILLDLFIAQAEGKNVSVSSACIGSASPATTGLRWLGVLADEGLVRREPDPDDSRRVMVRLTSAGRTAMEQFFDTAKKD